MASIFAKTITKTVEVPGDAPHTITVRKLSGQQIVSAQDQVKDSPTHWRRAVIERGLIGWTYDVPVSAEWLDELDSEASDFIAAEIMKLTTPSAFTPPGAAEAEQKNG